MFQRPPAACFLICIGIGLLGFISSLVPLFSDAEESLGLRLLYLLRGTAKAPENIVIVAIDAESAEAMHLPVAPNKWPRQLHARLVEKLAVHRPAVIAFDMIFYEPQDDVNDRAFGAAMQKAGNVVLTQSIDRQTIPIAKYSKERAVHMNIERLVSPIPVLADAAAGQAPFPLPTVPVQLNQYWCFRPGSADAPTLPVVALHVYVQEAFPAFVRLLLSVDGSLSETLPLPVAGAYGAKARVAMIVPLHASFQNRPWLAAEALETIERNPPFALQQKTKALVRALIHLYRRGNSSYLNFYGPPGSIRTISYHRFLETDSSVSSTKAPNLPEGCAVFVGQTGSTWLNTHDRFYTVFSGKMGQDVSGVEIAATAFANLLQEKDVHPLASFPKAAVLLGWALLAVSLVYWLPTFAAMTGILITAGLYLMLAKAQFASSGIWYPLVVPLLLQTPAAFMVCLLAKYRKVRIERENIREAFGYYLPDDVVDRVSATTKALRLGGQVFYGVCLFTDAQNYTTLSERLDPSSLTRLMNSYYDAVFRPIQANEGLVLQVVGDAVMALWSAPEPREELKLAACRAAVEITHAVERFNRRADPFGMPTRIGIHAGEMFLGNVGSSEHFEYRPVGDIVNTASRLEGLNKHLGTTMLVSQEGIGLDENRRSRSMGWFVFKGKSQPVHVHQLEPLRGLSPEQRKAVCHLFDAGLTAFRNRQWDQAGAFFEKVLQINGSDGPALFYQDRCTQMKKDPPGEKWQGEVYLKRK